MIFIKKFNAVKKISGKIKSDALLLYLCWKDKRTPLSAKIISAAAIALAFSPIDLIPDFIPVLGYLDDIIIIPLLMYLAFKLIPEYIILENKNYLQKIKGEKIPVFRKTGIIIAVLWLITVVAVFIKLFQYMRLI